jgi:carbohydrate binding protein with CBM4/9 domain
MFAVVVVAILASTAIGAAPPPTGTPVVGSAAPSGIVESGVPVVPAPTPLVDPAVVDMLAKLNDQLGAAGTALKAELARVTFRPKETVTWVRQVNSLALTSADVVRALKGALGPDQPGGRLSALYGSIADSAGQTLRASITFEEEYRVGARELIGLIAQLPALQAELDALAVPPSPSPTPTPAPPSASPSPSAAPTRTPAPSRSIAPSASPVGSPRVSPAANEMIENGSFEAGVGPPWGLFLGPGANASVVQDPTLPDTGAASARIDIVSGGLAYSGISLRQDGLALDAARLYSLSIRVRADSPREVRVQIASKAGAPYSGTRTVQVTRLWSTIDFTFTSNYNDPDAVLQLDMGTADSTTWWDSVSLQPVGG